MCIFTILLSVEHFLKEVQWYDSIFEVVCQVQGELYHLILSIDSDQLRERKAISIGQNYFRGLTLKFCLSLAFSSVFNIYKELIHHELGR